jgi:hypothetical protein
VTFDDASMTDSDRPLQRGRILQHVEGICLQQCTAAFPILVMGAPRSFCMVGQDQEHIPDRFVDAMRPGCHVPCEPVGTGLLRLSSGFGHLAGQQAAAKTRLERHAAQAFFSVCRSWSLSERVFGLAGKDRVREFA